MKEHRYILQPYKSMKDRFICPSCNKGKTFSLYIDTETGEHVAQHVGRCNRETSCSYHYTPKQYFQDNNISFDTTQQNITKPNIPKVKPAAQTKPVSFIPVDVFKASLKSHTENNFATYLTSLFGLEATAQLISKYFIGTSKHWPGATVFYQIDTAG